jgi:SPX domain protein involved in polyphosphate accumulation
MNRYEYKFQISAAEAADIGARLSAAMAHDKNYAEKDYFIRSLYFDDRSYSAYYDKVNGVEHREKFRIRFYNNDPSYIVFERKLKHGIKVEKSQFNISETEARKIISGDFSVLAARLSGESGNNTTGNGTNVNSTSGNGASGDLASDLYAKFARGFFPAAVTDYEREAFTHPASRTRVTLDKNLRALLSFNIFDDYISLPIYEKGDVILEVKFDEVLPEFIKLLLPRNIGQPLAISKYCLCREKLLSCKGVTAGVTNYAREPAFIA